MNPTRLFAVLAFVLWAPAALPGDTAPGHPENGNEVVGTSSASAGEDERNAVEPVTPIPELAIGNDETVIEGDRLEMISREDQSTFTFHDNVKLTGQNLIITCDRLQVTAVRSVEDDNSPGQQHRIESIVASGNVRILQQGREATAGRAEVYPIEGILVLSESPVVRDSQGRASGERIVINRGERRAIIEGSPSERARVVVPALPDLGFDDNREASD